MFSAQMDAVIGKNNGFNEGDQWHKPSIKQNIKVSKVVVTFYHLG